jgi:hypothetical protein
MQSGRQQGQQAGCVVARGAVHDAMASIAARAARRAASKSSMSGAIASTIALAMRSMRSGAARIAGSLSATCAQNVPKAAFQRPAKGPQSAVLARQPPEIGIMRALNRYVERVFDPPRKDHHWGRRKPARDQ